ncbi:MAG: CapA family protein [Bacteroidales bacterium]|nr:CapA family protein [Bacteroidales bacterium]
MIIAAVGDIMPGGVWSGREGQFVSDEILEELQKADIRVGTLETAIGDAPNFYDEKMSRSADVIYAKDDDLKRMKALDINVVSLANNHFFDLSPENAVHTIALLDSLGIRHCGAGSNLEEASKPVVYEKDGKTIAFLAFCDWRNETVGWCPFATEDKPGVNPMYDDYVVGEITKYKRLYDYVAVIPHWGKEHTFVTTNHVYQLANKMLKAGADMIFGGHTHRVQPVVKKRNAVVAYSMGNFFFPDRLITKPRSTYYPDETIDVDRLPVTYQYPFVEETTLKIWKPLARIGEVVLVEIEGKKIRKHVEYVQLKKDNTLVSSSLPLFGKVVLGWQKMWLNYLPYPLMENMFSKTKRFLKKCNKRRRS